MSAPQTITGHSPINALRGDAGIILTERDLASVAAALQGINAITSVLTQREIDAESFNDGLTFEPALATGLLMALASCTDLAEGVLASGGLCGARAEYGTKAYAALVAGRNAVIKARKEEGKQ